MNKIIYFLFTLTILVFFSCNKSKNDNSSSDAFEPPYTVVKFYISNTSGRVIDFSFSLGTQKSTAEKEWLVYDDENGKLEINTVIHHESSFNIITNITRPFTDGIFFDQGPYYKLDSFLIKYNVISNTNVHYLAGFTEEDISMGSNAVHGIGGYRGLSFYKSVNAEYEYFYSSLTNLQKDNFVLSGASIYINIYGTNPKDVNIAYKDLRYSPVSIFTKINYDTKNAPSTIFEP